MWRERRPCVSSWLGEDLSVSITGSLTDWGWNSYFEALWPGGDWKSAVPARVVGQQRKFWPGTGGLRASSAEASGTLRRAAARAPHWPGGRGGVVAGEHPPAPNHQPRHRFPTRRRPSPPP